jgi:preprotein translocase subunit YajC
LILRPQQKQGKERQEMLKNLKRGDNVITSGGIYGRVLNITGDIVTLEIAKGVSVRISRAGITNLAGADEEEKKVKEEKSEK